MHKISIDDTPNMIVVQIRFLQGDLICKTQNDLRNHFEKYDITCSDFKYV